MFKCLCLYGFFIMKGLIEKALVARIIGSGIRINSLLPRIDFYYLGCHKTYFWVGRG